MWAIRTKNTQRGVTAPLERVERPVPEPASDEVQIQVKAIGVNRADYFIRQGLYTLDSNDSDILGAEVAGVISKVGASVTNWSVGDEVCSVTPHAAAYAEYVVVPAAFPLKKPPNMDFETAASLPVGLLTAWYNIFMKGGLQKDEKLLVQGGTSGMGILAIQMAREMGAKVFATAGGPEHCRICEELGATTIDYKDPSVSFEQYAPFRVIYDILGGGDYFRRNVEALELGGHLRILSFLGGRSTSSGIKLQQLHKPGGQFDVSKSQLLAAVQSNHTEEKPELFSLIENLNRNRRSASDIVTIGGDAVRRWDRDIKDEAVRQVQKYMMPLVESGKIVPVVDGVYPFQEAEQAHERIFGSHVGKVVITGYKGTQR